MYSTHHTTHFPLTTVHMWWGRCPSGLHGNHHTSSASILQAKASKNVTLWWGGQEENRRGGNRAIFATCIHDFCLWNVSEPTNCHYNVTLCPSSGVNESAIAWTSTHLYKAMPSLEPTATQLHPTHKVKGFHIQHFRYRNLLTDLCFPPN